MKEKIRVLLPILLISLITAGCGGRDPELDLFKEDIETFCVNISSLDNAINQIDVSAEDAPQKLLGYIDQLDMEFQNLAKMDFPEKFDYLETLADDAAEYMSEAGDAYHMAYEGDTYAENYNDFAYENYKRAYSRIQVLIACLRGEEPGEQDFAGTQSPD